MSSHPFFKVQINSLDSYICPPSLLDPTPSSFKYDRVPVIRIFGSLPTGHTTCVHIHGVLPYLFVGIDNDWKDLDQVKGFAHTLHEKLEELVRLSFRRKKLNAEDFTNNNGDVVTVDPALDNKSNKSEEKVYKYIANVEACKSTAFYGYHVGHSIFFKISFLGPVFKNRILTVLESPEFESSVPLAGPNCKKWNIYESNASYILQFMTDFNLFGCGWLEVGESRKLKNPGKSNGVYFRSPVFNNITDEFYEMKLSDEVMEHINQYLLKENRNLLTGTEFGRISDTFVEVDVSSKNILNREKINLHSLHHNFIEKLSSLQTQSPSKEAAPFQHASNISMESSSGKNLNEKLKYISSTKNIWQDDIYQRKIRNLKPYEENTAIDRVLGNKEGWNAQQDLDEMFKYVKMMMKRNTNDGAKLSEYEHFAGFIKEPEFFKKLMTPFELITNGFYDVNLSKASSDTQTSADARQVDNTPLHPPSQEHSSEIEEDHDSLDFINDLANESNKSEKQQHFAEDFPKLLPENNLGNGDDNEILKDGNDKKRAWKESLDNDDITDNISFDDLSFSFFDSINEDNNVNGDQRDENSRTIVKDDHVVSNSRRNSLFEKGPLRKKNRKPVPLSSLSKLASVRKLSPTKPKPRATTIIGARKMNLCELVPSSGSKEMVRKEMIVANLSKIKVRNILTSRVSKLDENTINMKNNQKNDNSNYQIPMLARFKFFSSQTNLYKYMISPPPLQAITDNISSLVVPQYLYSDPFYGNSEDVPAVPFVNKQIKKRFKLKSRDWKSLDGVSVTQKQEQSISVRMRKHAEKNYESEMIKINDNILKKRLAFIHDASGVGLGIEELSNTKVYRYTVPKPRYQEVLQRFQNGGVPGSSISRSEQKNRFYTSQIEFLTPKFLLSNANNSGKKKSLSPLKKVNRRPDGFNNLSLFAIEMHISTRGNLSPDYKQDEVSAIFWKIDPNSMSLKLDIVDQGILILKSNYDKATKRFASATTIPIEVFDSELDMFKELVSLVKVFDPDLLSSYEIHSSSWGYIIDRCTNKYKYDILKDLARVNCYFNNKVSDNYGYNHASGISVTGRYFVNVWRLLRSELALGDYNIENVVFAVFKKRIPSYSMKKLTELFGDNGSIGGLSIFVDYYVTRVNYDIELLESLDMIYKIVEQARLGGIDFYSVFYRGSQFKVESFLLRLAKSENFMLSSPSKKEVRRQKALECIPLVMEPTSNFYKSPLVVLDFQSLYPSIIIAYNYCYSTCIGRLQGFSFKKANKLGVTSFKTSPELMRLLSNDINISPNGLMFVNTSVRKSMLAKMLEEILATRFMIKSTMKLLDNEKDKDMKRLYDSRQLALKLIANVTYGYTSATFSGRMPCSDIADAIVQTGRETLEKSARVIESVKEWNAKVVYGDTDSLFVYLPGRSKAEAFKLGRAIAAKITEINPDPITLKFEKVYHPSVLLAKKRYVGYSYESEDQIEPKFDAKGIETIRRDGIPAQQKITEKALRLLFETQDVSQIKSYVKNQFYKIMTNKVSIQDFCFSKEIRIGGYKNEKTMPPGALLVAKKMNQDQGYEPQYRERVPYLILKNRGNGDRLKDKAVLLEDVTDKPDNFVELDAEYYITKMLVPPLERIFSLIGVDVKEWYYEMPKYLKYDLVNNNSTITNDKNPGYTTTSSGRIILDNNNKGNKNVENLLQKYIQTETCLNCGKKITHKPVNFGDKHPANLCEACAVDEVETMHQVMNRVKLIEMENQKYQTICRICSVQSVKGAGSFTEICCENASCPVYYSRVRSKMKMNEVMKILDRL
ncbi:DNA-directed DNA polymerase [Saccharomycopsis crataegensis]|uniref:DNA polymerase n=1 Tax=Saccharomycopsis crataegensis TaxID=43959 RepID=A0AAV5QHK3_9ASCO|nr:DNA-directed DNA polymerase [Saccharomycopsis crataegensis]